MANRSINQWMWARAFEMLSEAEQQSSRFFEVTTQSTTCSWQAPIDVFEEQGDLVIWVALPGVDPEQVEVLLRSRILHIAGVRRLQPKGVIRRLEIPYGHFERSLELPSSDYQIIEHDYQNGCLQLRLRR